MKTCVTRIRLGWQILLRQFGRYCNKFRRPTATVRSAYNSSNSKIFPNALHALLITWVLDQETDDLLRAIVDLSKNSEFYVHDSVIAEYEHTAPLRFDFLTTPIVFRYTVAGYPYELQPKQIKPSQCILYDLGNYSEDMDIPDGYVERNVVKTEQLNLPMVYFIYARENTRLDILKSKIHVAAPENLMIFDNSELNSLKKILTRLVDITAKQR